MQEKTPKERGEMKKIKNRTLLGDLSEHQKA
jgi:hypothetical protein